MIRRILESISMSESEPDWSNQRDLLAMIQQGLVKFDTSKPVSRENPITLPSGVKVPLIQQGTLRGGAVVKGEQGNDGWLRVWLEGQNVSDDDMATFWATVLSNAMNQTGYKPDYDVPMAEG